MTVDEEQRKRALEEECPGPRELESALTQVKLSDVALQAPLTVSKSTPLAAVVRMMQKERRASALIVEEGRLAGIFTERDVLMKVVGRALDLARTPVSACMTPDPLTLPADASVAFALNKMVHEGFRHIPLIDTAGRPAAVISMRNVIEYMGEVYWRDLLTIPPDPQLAPSRHREGA